MRFLCVSDIHGHASALRAVIREAEALGFDQLIACGDLCFPGPEPLEVWKILVQPGQEVESGASLVILESMKMEIPIEAEDDGTVAEVLVQEGQAVNEGDVVLVLR